MEYVWVGTPFEGMVVFTGQRDLARKISEWQARGIGKKKGKPRLLYIPYQAQLPQRLTESTISDLLVGFRSVKQGP